MRYIHVDARSVIDVMLSTESSKAKLLDRTRGKSYMNGKDPPTLSSLRKAASTVEGKIDIWNSMLTNISRIRNFLSIDTDGYAVSVHTGTPCVGKRGRESHANTGEIPYCKDLSVATKQEYRSKRLVSINPNMGDLIYATAPKLHGPRPEESKKSKASKITTAKATA